MKRKTFAVTTIICLITFLGIIAGASAETIDIKGPWLWMIAPTEKGKGGADSIETNSLSLIHDGYPDKKIAQEGANEDDQIGKYKWTPGFLPDTGWSLFGHNNINECLISIGMVKGNLDDHSSYALITLESRSDQDKVTMHVGSDDAIKVWLNGIWVYTKKINRATRGVEDAFRVNLKQGDNLLMVKVSERNGRWGMHVKLDAPVTLKQTTRTIDIKGPWLWMIAEGGPESIRNDLLVSTL